jgi:16S rRNA processing protein RimM
LIEIGVFGGPHGVRGEVRLFPSTDDPAARLRAGERWVAPPPGGLGRTALPRPVRVAGSRAVVSRGKETWLVRLDGVADADGAAALTNQRLLIPASARPPLPPGSDEWYVQDLAGATVVLEEGGSVIGRVSDVYVETGGADLLRLELDRKTDGGVDGGPVDPSLPLPTVLLPFTREFAPSFDAATRTLTIAPPAGLLDLATSPGSGRKASRRPKTTRKARDGGAREAKREASGAGGERRGAGASDEGE